MKELKKIGCKIKSRRLAMGYRQYELAHKVKVTQSHICLIESGKAYPSLKVLFKICKELEIKPESLMTSI